ncbi:MULTISPECIES: MFS transporter [Paenibacillus]|uniref:MFS transporter n=1 Tax=Paenibacillus phytohabitans TaxID=2654978 RepID=A0ABX1YVG1_9BACL|nr:MULTISPECIES: MFS transporter [Paenibacillus]AIQ32790.1 MFS transporter [Paenibacillus sp. FSL P4-0081]NOU83599.1 MFS transporter [Paenibacillus phytohabitans]OMF22601.1 MFS transporter [Paenibacillus sp. FSL H8-0259]
MRENLDKQLSFTSLKWFNFFVYGTVVLFTSFFPLYLQIMGMNKLEIGSLMSVGALVSIIANPFWGIWSDRYQNIRRIVLVMLTGTLVLSQLVFQANTYEMIYISILFFYFFQGPLFAQSNTMILSYIDGTSQRFSSYRLWGSLGWAFTAILAGPVIEWAGVSVLSYLFAALLCAAMIALIAMPKLDHSIGIAPLPFRGLRQIFYNPFFLCFILFGILVSIPNTMNNTFVSLYITELGGSKTMIGLAVFLSSILEMGVLLLCNYILKRKISVLLASLTFVSALFFLRWWMMADATTPLQVALIQVLHCITFGGFFYVGTQLTMLLVPRAYRSSGQALYTLTWSGISGILGGVLGGWMYQNLGVQTMYQSGALLALFGTIGFGLMWLFFIRGGYRPPADPEDGAAEE